MSWEDMMRRILPSVDGASHHVTSRYGERFNRPKGSSNPHGGIDFNYEVGGQRGIDLEHPDLRSPVAYPRPDSSLPPNAQRSFSERFGYWPSAGSGAASPANEPRQALDTSADTLEDWSAMWRRRTGLP
jgi:hypothetical protein